MILIAGRAYETSLAEVRRINEGSADRHRGVPRWPPPAARFLSCRDFDAYFAAMYPLGIEGLPLDRLVRQAREAVEADRSIP